jgi:hypothetical protein
MTSLTSRAEYQRRYRARRKTAGVPIHSAARLVKQAEWLSETYHALRAALYDIVGRICVGCGHGDVRVLEFDHVEDDGAADRRRFKGARSMLDFYVKNPGLAKRKLQSLCRNCNWLKRKGVQLEAR